MSVAVRKTNVQCPQKLQDPQFFEFRCFFVEVFTTILDRLNTIISYLSSWGKVSRRFFKVK
jgi:hypothetical protein